MKTVFVTIGESFTARNIFKTPFWQLFKQNNPGVKIVLLVLPEKKEHYQKLFGDSRVAICALDPKLSSRSSRIITSLMRSALNSHTNLWSKMRSFTKRESSLLTTCFKRLHTSLLGRSAWYKSFLRYLLLKEKPREALSKLYDIYKPSLLFATSLTQFDFDVPIALEAKRRGIRVLGMVRSWDNLSSHGLLRVVPDLFILQNKFLKTMAWKYQAIDPKKVPIKVVGLPHYDIYKNPQPLLEPREVFFEKLGLDPARKLILYGAMGDFLFPHESEMADLLENLIASGEIKGKVQVIFRAHPKFQSSFERMKDMHYVRPDRKATYLTSELKSVEIEEEDEKHLLNSICHSDIVVAGASTIALDAVILGKPVICVGFDGLTDNVPYWLSVKRFYDTYTHYEAFMETGAAHLAHSSEELVQMINELLENPTPEETTREKAIKLLVAPFDGHASERLENAVSLEVRKILD